MVCDEHENYPCIHIRPLMNKPRRFDIRVEWKISKNTRIIIIIMPAFYFSKMTTALFNNILLTPYTQIVFTDPPTPRTWRTPVCLFLYVDSSRDSMFILNFVFLGPDRNTHSIIIYYYYYCTKRLTTWLMCEFVR